jgi:N-acetylglucosaminyldiphosphoundecaprenol N-acetyl-beta-D-mannosaminyltransferase
MLTTERIRVAGCPVDLYSSETALAELCRRIDSRTQTHVVFVNAAKAVQYHENAALREVLERADILLADGMPIVWLSRLKGTPLPERVAGVDLMEKMVAAAADRGYRVFFLGGYLEVVFKAVSDFQRRYPRLSVVGYRNGYFSSFEEEEVSAQIRASKADLVLIAMSSPQKELWADRNLGKLGVSVCQGVGGGFDIIAGVTKRAPKWMQAIGLEWSYRLLQEPGRMWRRYTFSNASFLLLAIWDLCDGFIHGKTKIPFNTDKRYRGELS